MALHRSGSLERAVLYDVRHHAARGNLKDAAAAADGKVRAGGRCGAGGAGGPRGEQAGQRACRAGSMRACAGTAPNLAFDRVSPDLTRGQVWPRVA